MSLLDVQHIKKIYKTRFQGTQVEALKDIHFTVEKGEYVAIMGESGSGKSTLLNILAMLDQPTEGRVYLNSIDTSTIKNKDASSFRREKLGFVFQDPGKRDGSFPAAESWIRLSRFQPARHLVCQGQYPLAIGPLSQTSQGNDEQGRHCQPGVGHSPVIGKVPLRNLWWAKTTGSRSTGHHHLTGNPPGR